MVLRLAPVVVLLALAFVPAYQRWLDREDTNGTCNSPACHAFHPGGGMSVPPR